MTTLADALTHYGQRTLMFFTTRESEKNAVTGIILAATPEVIVLRLAKTRQVVVMNPAHVIMVREAVT